MLRKAILTINLPTVASIPAYIVSFIQVGSVAELHLVIFKLSVLNISEVATP